MARVQHVKKARKNYPAYGIKKGQEYWWISMKTGPRSSIKKYFTKPPRPSQTTTSEFYQNVYSIQEDMEDAKPADVEELTIMIEEWKGRIEEVRDTCQERFDNMPEGLQQGDTGQMLEERISAMDDWCSELDSFDTENNDGETDEECMQRLLEELSAISPSC